MIILAAFLLTNLRQHKTTGFCLPKDVKLTDVVSTKRAGHGEINKITVEQKLQEVRARCKKGKLVDSSGKEIYFYRLTGCWGNPPVDYLEILNRQNAELERLKKRYRVIEMTCNPAGEQIY